MITFMDAQGKEHEVDPKQIIHVARPLGAFKGEMHTFEEVYTIGSTADYEALLRAFEDAQVARLKDLRVTRSFPVTRETIYYQR